MRQTTAWTRAKGVALSDPKRERRLALEPALAAQGAALRPSPALWDLHRLPPGITVTVY